MSGRVIVGEDVGVGMFGVNISQGDTFRLVMGIFGDLRKMGEWFL